MANGFAPLIKIKEINAKLDEMIANIQNEIDTWESDINNSLNNLEGNINDNLAQWKSDIEDRFNNDTYFNIAPSEGILYKDENEYYPSSTDEITLLEFQSNIDVSLEILINMKVNASGNHLTVRVYKNDSLEFEDTATDTAYKTFKHSIDLVKDDRVKITIQADNIYAQTNWKNLIIRLSESNRIISIL